MNRTKLLAFFLLLLVPFLVLRVVGVLAQSGGGYDLSWGTVDGGGETMSGGPYILDGTLGQPDTNVLQGGDYVLGTGFWGGGPLAAQYRVYLPVVLHQGIYR